MSTALVTTTPANRLTNLPHARWVAMGEDCMRDALWRRKICMELDRLNTGWGMAKHFAMIADRERGPDGKPVLIADNWKKVYAKWRNIGVEGLINHTLCGGNCEVESCFNRARKSMLAESTVKFWIAIATHLRAPGNNLHKTRTLSHAWTLLIEKLQKGEVIPGVDNGRPGTWRAVYRRLHPVTPDEEYPEDCPWTTIDPPHGYTLQNFMLRAPARAEITGAVSGFKVLAEQLPQVTRDWGKLMPLEEIVIDDVDLDVICCGTYGGRMQFVRVCALFLMDACSRRIVGVKLIPQWEREDGTTVGISRRDVQHAFLDFVSTFGWRKTGTRFVSENATAAFSDEFCELVEMVTNGGIKMDRSGLFNLKVLMDGYGETGGNPRGKSILERFFGYLAICLSDGLGATGGTYQRKPGDLTKRLQECRKLEKRLGDKTTPEELMEIVPVESLPELTTRILDTLHRIENRPKHNLQGFDRVRRWRPFVGGAWKAFDDPVMLKMLQTMGREAVNEMLKDKDLSEDRVETQTERWTRLYDKADIIRLDPLSYFDLAMDRAKVKYAGVNVIKLSFKGAKIEFGGTRHNLQPGQEVEVAFNVDHLEMGAYLRDATTRRPMGQMDWAQRAGNREELEQKLGVRQAAKSDMLNRIAVTNLPAEKLAELIEAEEHTIARLEYFGTRADALLKPSESTKDLVNKLGGGEDDEEESSAAAYLANRQ
jgi:hypothetical protein